MKQKIIRLTEQDLHSLIRESAMQLIKEWDRDEWDEAPEDFMDQPEFDDVTVYFNPETKACKTEDDELEDGLWYECIVSVNDWHNENDGIGHYEFWGHPGYDEGHTYGVVDSVSIEVDGVYQVEGDEGDYVEDTNPTLSPEDEKIVEDFVLDNEMLG